VRRDAPVEQHHLLRHHAELAAHARGVERAQVVAVEQHAPGGGVVHALHEPQHRALARARRAHERHGLAGAHHHVEAVERAAVAPV
ncbi:MAG: hypothetical protein AVDCRST_MAG11-2237, partial [uncultured Gemmatimonadaceae bacterium]